MIKDVKITVCYHCGETSETENIHIREKVFCCQGCKTVYEIINKVELCEYYNINENPGINQKTKIRPEKFAFLDDEKVQEKLIHFKDENQSHITFYLPQMHCSSCIWLLENLGKLNNRIVRSQVNFLKKEVSVIYDHKYISLRKITELLTDIGYEPHFSLNSISEKKVNTYDKSRIYKIGITGFCFANIMMLSFPDYFSLGNIEESGLQQLFSYLCLGLSLPVFFYGASEFFISAWKSIKQHFLNIDTPIALAIVITFVRSVYEIISGNGAGYLDSMSGIVFFMLIGRFFQNKTYNTLTFNRDYTSYFPLGVTIITENAIEKQISVSDLKMGHRIKIHHEEIIPADCILFLGKAKIDYSFVSGEALPVEKRIGEIVYAGGKQTGGSLELEVIKEVSQSYLTQLWNDEAFTKDEEKNTSYIHTLSKYFTLILFTIATITATYWYFNDTRHLWNAVTSILIVACPCALLLSATFTNGNMLRILQKFGFYARNAEVIEQLSNANEIIFDKTGTITQQQEAFVFYEGKPLDPSTEQYIRSLVNQSSHPLSKAITNYLPERKILSVKYFNELKGFGIRGVIDNKDISLGSNAFVNHLCSDTIYGSRVYVKVNDEIMGCFKIQSQYRPGLKTVLSQLQKKYRLSLLSGDNDSERKNLAVLFNGDLLFDQTPQQKLNHVQKLQQQGKKVIMVGDGLNDAGSLKQSNVGIAITDNINNFSPACDVIMEGKSFYNFVLLLDYSKKTKIIINISFVLSILYNIIGLYFAVQGQLQPVIAAILMPVSSISIVLLTTGLSSIVSYKLRINSLKSSGNPNTDINHIGY
ncbi:MAG: heavy metal translocating P-type ATPase metal-binding domain-containing protein [Bacteroidetes bacterium]|nr:heavy metal translocating P-type ATPase metal-binding domain-containing protein [Bacteroidota bacterium]